jgi:tRNA1(Val) A37 N6-methylase TrmN6
MHRALDLGCGIGSVLMMVAWSFPEAELLGVEAQARSVELLRRSLRFNGAEQRVRVVHADLREHARWWTGERFDLVTGTPPYLPVGTGTRSRHSQCDSCRFELRGGIEAYCEAAALALATDGRFVFCEGDTSVERVPASLEAAGLTLLQRQAIHGRVGKPPLFHVFVAALARQANTESTSPDAAPLFIRDQSGARTPDYVALRRRRGLPE